MFHLFKELVEKLVRRSDEVSMSFRQFRQNPRIDTELIGIIDQTLGKFRNILPN